MQWSCPHCGVTLAVPYDTLGTGWSFSRCYKCAGFALIRRAEVNIIKVDKAPPGEKVILPEAGIDPTAGLLTEDAAQKLAKHTSKEKAEKPTVRPARVLTPPPAPKISQKFDEFEHLDIQGNAFEPLDSKGISEGQTTKALWKRTPPFGIIMATLFVVASGIYLFSQGQSSYQKVKDTASESRSSPGQKISSTTQNSALPHKPVEIANPSVASNTSNEANSNNSNTNVAKAQDLNGTQDTNLQSNNHPVSETKIVATQKVSRPMITDQVQESAMAPLKSKSATSNAPTASTTMLVQTRLKRVSLHDGPGMQFPVTGIANPDIRYIVADWKDRWFKIALNTRGALNDVGWIRNDMVQVMPSTFLGDTVPDINPLRQ